MSFLTDLFHGNTGNLLNDLSPSNILSDAGTDFAKQPEWAKIGEVALPAILGTIFSGGTDLPALLGGAGGIGSLLGLGGDVAADTVGGSLAGVGGDIAADLSTTAGGGFGGTDIASLLSTLGGGSTDALALTDPAVGSLATDPGITAINSALTPAVSGAGGASLDIGGSSIPIDASEIMNVGDTAAGGSSTLGSIGSWLANNKGLLATLGLGVGGQVLSPSIMQALGLNKVPGSQNLTNLASNLGAGAAAGQAQGQTLQSYLTSGGLPAGQQQEVTQATNDAINTIKSRYAGLGLSGSTAEADAISYAQANAAALAGQFQQQDYALGQQTINTAIQEMGMQEGIYNTILQDQIAQDNLLGTAIGNFTKALGTGYGTQAAKQTLTS